MMNSAELQKTIDWLRDFIFRMEDRFNGEQLKEQLDRLKATVRELEDRLEHGQPLAVSLDSLKENRDAL